MQTYSSPDTYVMSSCINNGTMQFQEYEDAACTIPIPASDTGRSYNVTEGTCTAVSTDGQTLYQMWFSEPIPVERWNECATVDAYYLYTDSDCTDQYQYPLPQDLAMQVNSFIKNEYCELTYNDTQTYSKQSCMD